MRGLFVALASCVLLLSCQRKQISDENSRPLNNPNIRENELLVQLTKLDIRSQVLEDYKHLGLLEKQVVSVPMKAVLYSFDTATIRPQKMLATLKADVRCVVVGFNKTISKRN